MVISMAAFTVNDAIAKFVSDSMNMAQVMLVRGIFASMLVGVIAWQSGALTQLRHALNSMVMLRVAGDAAGTLPSCWRYSICHSPMCRPFCRLCRSR